jgi:hypothetical protein
VPLVEIRPGRPRDDAGRALIAAAVAELAVRYEGPQDPEVDPDDIAPPRGAFLLALLDGAPMRPSRCASRSPRGGLKPGG